MGSGSRRGDRGRREALPRYQAFICLRESPLLCRFLPTGFAAELPGATVYLDGELIRHILTAQGDLRVGSATLPSESSIQRSLLSISGIAAIVS